MLSGFNTLSLQTQYVSFCGTQTGITRRIIVWQWWTDSCGGPEAEEERAMAHGLASALSDRQTDVFPLTQSCTSEMAAWLVVANFKCELSFLGAILAHIEGRLNFILFTCCQLLAVLLQKPMSMVNTTELPPIYLVLLENRKNVCCIFSLSRDCTLATAWAFQIRCSKQSI